MGERKFYQIITWKRVNSGEEFTKKYSFKTSESAIKDGIKWRDKTAKDIARAVVKIEIIDKESNEIVWSWEA